MKIAILGAGSFGSSIAQIMLDNNHEVSMWAYNQAAIDTFFDPQNTYIQQQLKQNVTISTDIKIVKDHDVVVFVVPSFALRESAKQVAPYFTNNMIGVLCSKGIERDSFKTGLEVLNEEIPNLRGVILSGPTHAEEISKRMFSAIVATSNNLEDAKLVQQIFNNQYFRVYTNNDVKGVELAGAVKNILAIAAGYCDGSSQFGDNTKALILTRGLRELKILTELSGGSVNTVYGLTGVGDLMVTAFSKYSRNRYFGELIAQGNSVNDAIKKVGMVAEGYYSLLAVHQIIEKYQLDLPVINLIYDVVYHQKDVNSLYKQATLRSLKSED